MGTSGKPLPHSFTLELNLSTFGTRSWVQSSLMADDKRAQVGLNRERV
jgi:hypothetical protein